VVLTVLAALVVGAAGFASAGAWFAGPAARLGENAPDRSPAARVEAISGLNLTDEQYAGIRGIMTASFERMTAFHSLMAQKMQELRLMYWQKTPDMTAIEAKHAEMEQLREQARDQQNMHDQILELLDDEQKEAFEQMRGFGMGMGMGRGHGRGMPRMMRKGNGGGTTR
jgi:Spy/CpxP family protein refolding chaperone